MSIIHLVFQLNGVGQRHPFRAGLTVSDLVLPGHASSVSAVTENSHSSAFELARASAVSADLAPRPGRRVRGWLAWRGDRPVGLATVVSARGGTGERHSIGWLLVVEAHRRTGVGSALVTTALAHVRGVGGREVWVETRHDWEAAIAFWRSTGFTVPGEA